MTAASLAQLVRPLDVEAFLRDVWGRDTWFAGQSLAFDVEPLLDLTSFEALLATVNGAQEGWLHFASGGRRAVPPHMIDDDGMIDLRQVRAGFAAGETLYLTKAHRLSPPLMRLCRALELEFGARGVSLRAPVSAHVFLTPPCAQGFAPHCDEHASFVLQLDGSKDWSVYEPAEAAEPVVRRAGGVDPASLASLARRTFHLERGDVLFVPQWWAHEARTSAAHSLHVTLRVFPLRWADVLREVCDEHPALGEEVPRHLSEDPKILAEGLVDALLTSGIRGSLADVVADVATRYRLPKTTLPDDGLRQALEVGCVGMDTPMHRSAGVSFRVSHDDHSVCLEFPGGVLRAPALLTEVFEYVAAAATVRAAELPLFADREYDRLEVVRRLAREGLIRRVDGPA